MQLITSKHPDFPFIILELIIDSRASSFSSSYSSISTLMQPEFAPKLLSVLMDTALVSATNACDRQPGDCLSHSVGGGADSLDGKGKQKRRGLLPVIESHSGVANALDPLTSSTSYALTCQDVEVIFTHPLGNFLFIIKLSGVWGNYWKSRMIII